MKISVPYPLPTMEKKLDKIIQYLARGNSNRSAEAQFHCDRGTYRFYMLPASFSSSMPSRRQRAESTGKSGKYSDKVCNDVINNKLTYRQVRKKYGIRGLQALYSRAEHLLMRREEQLSNQVVKLREQGLSFNQIGYKLGICPYTANTLYTRKAKVISNVYVSRERGKAVAKRILELYNQGMSIPQIAQQVNRSFSHISFILRRAGIKQKRGCLSMDDLLRVHKLRQAGVMWHEIGYIYGIPFTNIQSYYRIKKAEVYKCLEKNSVPK